MKTIGAKTLPIQADFLIEQELPQREAVGLLMVGDADYGYEEIALRETYDA